MIFVLTSWSDPQSLVEELQFVTAGRQVGVGSASPGDGGGVLEGFLHQTDGVLRPLDELGIPIGLQP